MATTRELTPEDAQALTALYDDYEWWAEREQADVRQALAETDVAVGVEADGDLVGAARVLTDFQYYAKVYDVIVDAERRDEGVGEQLLRAVRDHPALQSTPGLELGCREGLVPFYESVGFEVYDRQLDVPDGGTAELVRMTLEFEG